MSFSGETVTFLRRPPPPRGRSHRSLHRSVLMFLNPSPFDCFPFVFVFPAVFPASSSMAGPLFFVSGHPTASSGARTSRHRRPACPRGRARCVPGPAAFHALHSSAPPPACAGLVVRACAGRCDPAGRHSALPPWAPAPLLRRRQAEAEPPAPRWFPSASSSRKSHGGQNHVRTACE